LNLYNFHPESFIMFEKNFIKEVRRLINLSYKTGVNYGLKYLYKEVIRFLRQSSLFLYRKEKFPAYLPLYNADQIASLLLNCINKPLISIITPIYNVSPEYLDRCIESVQAQYYENWELCLYDDGSTNIETLNCLSKWINVDQRIKITFGTKNLHISLASNEAINVSKGDFIGFLDHDDELLPETLLEVVNIINAFPKAKVIYTDEDLISPAGKYYSPHFKSDFNKSLILSLNYITHFVVVDRKIGDDSSWFRKGLEGAQDHDLILRLIEKTNAIIHIPKVLYHWRQSETSTSYNYYEKSYAREATRKALADYAERNRFSAEILNGPAPGVFYVKRKIITNQKVSIIIPFKDQPKLLRNCIESILTKTIYKNYEILLVSNNSIEEKTFNYLNEIRNRNLQIKILEYNIPFNFSAINNWAVKQSNGEYILLLNNDIKVINAEWLDAMIEQIQIESTGVVGAKLLYADKTIQHAGVILGIGGIAGHSHRFLPDSYIGYFCRARVIQNFSAVTGACLLTKRKLWEKVGGLDEEQFKIAFNDIDYCLKIRQLGYDVIYTPYSRLYHYESKSRGYENTPEKIERFREESQSLKNKWGTDRIPDPFYNINLTLDSENFSLK
jgi:O-antigen biosynthesis protein